MANRQSTILHQRLENTPDLATLSPVSDDIIVACLRERYATDNIYVSVSSNTLVALNPHKYVPSNGDSVLMRYAAEYRNTSEDKEYLPPHIFQLANNAYYHMRRTAQDQSILLSGETCSGKSENRRLAIKSLIELSVSNPGKKGSKLSTQIPSAEFVLECFGNARTLFNPNASRFGKYTELQFTERGRLCGIKTLDYYLERNRVAGAPSGERNFHIFYYLVAGASVEERDYLKLTDKSTFRYLGPRQATAPGQEEDATRFDQLKTALKSIGLSKRVVAQTCQLLAAILHLGNLEFIVDRQRNEDAAVVKNTDVLELVADFLGVQPQALENALSCKMKMVKKELCTVFLDPDGASDNRDDLAKILYSLLFAWLNESINQKLCRDDFTNFIGLFDLPGPQNMATSASRSNSLDQFCVNFANERLHGWIQKRVFESHVDEYKQENISRYVPAIPYFDNSECVRLLSNMPGGLIHIMDDQARRMPKKTDHSMVDALGKRWGNHSSFKVGGMDRSGFPTFTVNHYNGPVTYSSEDFLEKNLDALNPDFVSLLRGSGPDGPTPQGTEGTGSVNPFIRSLFSGKAIATQAHPRDMDTIVAAQQTVKPMRAPSTRRKGTVKRKNTLTGAGAGEDEKDDDELLLADGKSPCVAGEFRAALDTLFSTLDETQAWFVFCINPNDSQLPGQLEGRAAKGQIRSAGLTEIARRNITVFEANMTPSEFCDRYEAHLSALNIHEGDEASKVEQTRTALELQERDIVLGSYKVFLSQRAFHRLEDRLRIEDVEEQKRNRLRDAEAEAGLDVRAGGDPYGPYSSLHGHGSGGDSPTMGAFNDPFGQSNQRLPLVANASPFVRADMYNDDYDGRSFHSDDADAKSRLTSNREDSMSNLGTESYAPSRNMFQNNDTKGLLGKEALPGEVLEGETTEDIKETSARKRWVAFVWMLTWWCPNIFLIWCGRMKRLDVRQAWREKLALNMMIWFVCGCAAFVIAVLGNLICPTEHVFNTSELASHNSKSNSAYTSIRGEVFDLSDLVPFHQRVVNVVPSKSILEYAGTDADDIFPIQVSAVCNGVSGSVNSLVTLNSKKYNRSELTVPRFPMTLMRWNYRVGFLGLTTKEVKSKANGGNSIAIYDGLVYDVSDYINFPPSVQAPSGFQPPSGVDVNYMDGSVIDLFKFNAGSDITKKLNSLNIDSDVLARQKTCLRNMFVVGKQDNRNAPQCLFATYILLALSVVMVSVIGFKFLAALSFGSVRAPEDHDKFIICQVPCYTEGEESMRKTIDSLARLKYDDKRKLIFIICDGMIVGSGNDRPTPRIVLDILGADPNNDPELLSFLSLGEGARQHNMGKVYSGLYECAGHVVPYIVVVKAGKPSERSKPGNRGKRDSQMLLMHFLNKVHFNSAMNPLELEIYHQIKNVIGVNPSFYEYLFMVDADTVVDTLSVNRLVSAMIHDKKLLGVCGETSLSNSKQSIITMMQVYEYYISHHLAKAFESLFGSVTCLPGCFTMYRLRTPDTHKPLFISNAVIEDYSENRVDTLHMKNLLHLGEDRYLTTLLLKHFPLYKTQLIRDAHAYTVAPDEWQVLLSQRRRWINSTVHNLGELVFLDRLCGFCCFSMRFIVLIDLLSTIIQPVTVGYIAYLLYLVIGKGESIPTWSIIMLAAIYGLQALIFLFRRKWDMIGWMMDDFSWGATRVVLGEKGKKMIVHDEGKFDPRSIPLKTWSDYENELWDKESNHSIGSWVPPAKVKNDGYADSRTASLYGRETYYEPRSYSPVPSQMQMQMAMQMYPPPGYQSGRNTPVGAYNNSPLRPMSEMGALQQPTPSRPVTNYLDMPIPGSHSPEDAEFGLSSMGPTDAELERAVSEVLQNADLNTITKKNVRQRLEGMFGVDLSTRKVVINGAIDRAILARS
ncbi:hypothetical protein EW145_g4215 [Phellinidium pouzarii]|uniref:chitin synthase n=1 Tax=Phellinidium pouzarii TaxID=167371 RepID=A0A4S4L4K2_9AGAM|nr:hypothetical protein EW145_g4215 [Phellinidium pouzarii]